MNPDLAKHIGNIPTTKLSWGLAWLLVYAVVGFYLVAGLANAALGAVNRTCEKVLGVEPNGEILMFVGAVFAGAVGQHWINRSTYRASPPHTPDVEDAGGEPDEPEPPEGRMRE